MVNKDSFKGLIPATVTPMKNDMEIDVDAYDSYLKWIVGQGIVGLAVNVDTGEGPTLTSDERVTLLELARKRLGDSKILVAGLSAASTTAAKEETKRAKDSGADVMLVFPNPAFRGNPPDPKALMDYCTQIAEAADIDLMLFQLQDALGGIEFDEASLRDLASLERVVAIKEAAFGFSKYKDTLSLIREIESEAGKEIAFLTGNDNFIFESFLWGCDGGLLGAGAMNTSSLVECINACERGDWKAAVDSARKFQPLVDLVFSPPVRAYRARTKACLYLEGLIPNKKVRPPLVDINGSELDVLRNAMRKAGLEVLR
jgi:4-hydroxy-tetrahydrodipicolinate synthase